MYGCSLKLPGDLITPASNQHSLDPPNYATQLKKYMSKLAPAKSRNFRQSTTYIDPSLQTCKYVFIRVDAVKPSLTPPYKGPYKVLDRHCKYFTVQLDNKVDTVCIDRLKPAFMECDILDPLNNCESNPTVLLQVNPSPSKQFNCENSHENNLHGPTSPQVNPVIHTRRFARREGQIIPVNEPDEFDELLLNNVQNLPDNPVITRSGRVVKPPKRYDSYLPI